MSKTEPPFRKEDIARAFSLAASTYDKAAFVQKEVGQRLLERLSMIKSEPKVILDVGAGTGSLTKGLQAQFPKSTIIGLDIASGMVEYAKTHTKRSFWKHQPHYVCGDMESLPFANQSFDLVFSNFSLQWSLSLEQSFQEFKRILKPDGALLFSTLGPLTLHELKQSWATVDNKPHVNEFMDMHDVGDLLLNTDLSNPVIDMEMITITYANIKQLLQDLKNTGARNAHRLRNPGLTSRQALAKLHLAYEQFKQGHQFPATFEVIYGYALKKQSALFRAKDGIVHIPGDKIPTLISV